MRFVGNDVLRAVVDTNVWVPAVLNPAGFPARILEAFVAGRFVVVTNELLLDELGDVLRRPRIARRYGIAEADVAALVSFLRHHAAIVEIFGEIKLCRDPDDDVVIETALRGDADALVSRDEDLARAPGLEAALRQLGVEVLTVQRFINLLANESEVSDLSS
ncbi:MAG: putative toxin-antitoxin system toxin component, PIN family [Thermomicrobiales bacterium]